jgi:hypothetical protein
MPSGKLAVIALLAIFQLGCDDRRASPRSSGEAFHSIQPRMMELKIDGKLVVLDPDSRDGSQSASINISNNRFFQLTAMDRKHDLTLNIKFEAADGQIGPGSYQSYTCARFFGCKDEEGKTAYTASLMPYMGDRMPEHVWIREAYDAPDLGHYPLKVTLASVGDSYQMGADSVKRIKGSFTGRLLDVDGGSDGPTTTVEGKFDLLAVERTAPLDHAP